MSTLQNQQSQAQSQKQFANPLAEHISLGRTLRSVLFFIPMIVLALILLPSRNPVLFGIFIIIGILCGVAVSGIRVAAQWERGVILRLGKFVDVRGPGILFVVPVIEYVRFIDTRMLAINIPRQKVITRDNVPAEIDSVLFFMVMDSEKAVVLIQDFRFATAQYAQAALRDVVGGLTLDELLSEREHIQAKIKESLEERVKEWGIHIDSIRLQDIELPEDLKRMMSRQASAEREKRATITKSEGDKLAAVNLVQASDLMQKSPLAIQLRTLQTIDGLGSSPSNTVILFPTELNALLETMKAKKG